MLSPKQQDRFSHTTIEGFIHAQSNLNTIPLAGAHIQSDAFFQKTPTQPDGPVDLLYLFPNDTPALAFQEIDTEQDEEEMYALVYIDPNLSPSWEKHVGHHTV